MNSLLKENLALLFQYHQVKIDLMNIQLYDLYHIKFVNYLEFDSHIHYLIDLQFVYLLVQQYANKILGSFCPYARSTNDGDIVPKIKIIIANTANFFILLPPYSCVILPNFVNLSFQFQLLLHVLIFLLHAT